ncbi:MAG TPA: hypothetical protein VIP28_14735 [Nocardioides sp.]
MAEHWSPTPGGFSPMATREPAPDQREEEDCPGGAVCEWACDQHTTEPAPSADTFGGEVYEGVRISEEGEGEHVWSYGHVSPAAMAKAVTAYDLDMLGELDASTTGPSEVRNVWAVLTQGGDWITWKDVTEDTPNAFPLTVVTR